MGESEAKQAKRYGCKTMIQKEKKKVKAEIILIHPVKRT
jgi:hypothetical protein